MPYSPFMSSYSATGVVKISRGRRHSAHLHWEHRCQPVPIEDHSLQPRTLRSLHRTQGFGGDPQRPAGGGGPRGRSVCGRSGQRGDPHQEPLPAGSLLSAGHHVPQRLQPRARRSAASQPQAARRVRSSLLCVHRGHHTFLHRGERDSCAHFLFSNSPSGVQQLWLPSWCVNTDKQAKLVTESCRDTDA